MNKGFHRWAHTSGGGSAAHDMQRISRHSARLLYVALQEPRIVSGVVLSKLLLIPSAYAHTVYVCVSVMSNP